MKIIDRLKKGARWVVGGISAGAVIVIAQFTGGQWIGEDLSGNPMYANPMEGAHVCDVYALDAASPVVPRDYLTTDKLLLTEAGTLYAHYSYAAGDSVRRFVREYRYQITPELVERYGIVQVVPDISFQSDK